jgi:hypothetical protein
VRQFPSYQFMEVVCADALGLETNGETRQLKLYQWEGIEFHESPSLLQIYFLSSSGPSGFNPIVSSPDSDIRQSFKL